MKKKLKKHATNKYLDTFETLTKCPYPNNIENCNLVTEMCGKLKQKHKNTNFLFIA